MVSDIEIDKVRSAKTDEAASKVKLRRRHPTSLPHACDNGSFNNVQIAVEDTQKC
jgi:hypothetical protein